MTVTLKQLVFLVGLVGALFVSSLFLFDTREVSATTQIQENSLGAIPQSGIAPLVVDFSGHIETAGYSIDFGDGSSSGDMNCASGACPAGGSGSVVNVSHTYTSPGTYTAKLRKHFASNAGNCAGADCNVVDSTTIVVESPTPFGANDISNVVIVDLNNSACDEGCWMYVITLNSGKVVEIRANGGGGELTLAKLLAIGYVGTLSDFLKLTDDDVVTTTPSPKPGIVKNFFSGVAHAFKSMFTKTVNFFFPGFSNRVSNREFSNLPLNQTTRPITHTIDEIEAIIINKNAGPSKCNSGQGTYQAYIIATYDELAVSGCSGGGELLELGDYLQSISQKLVDYHNYEALDPKELAKLPIYFGDAEADLAELLNGESNPKKIIGDIDFEVKVKNQAGTVVQDWTSSNVTILSTDQLFFRWQAEEYTQCLPYLADNGNYALTRYDNRSMTSGNTESEGYNVTELAALYSVECSWQATSDDLRINSSSIKVSFGNNRKVEPHPTLEVTPTSGAAPLTVYFSATTSDVWFGGTYIDFGDGSTQVICNQPLKSGACSTSHIYNIDGVYSVKFIGVGEGSPATTTLDSSVVKVGTSSASLTITPASGKAPLAVTLKTANTAVNEKMAGCKYAVGFFGPSGNGLTVDWGDGLVEPGASNAVQKSGQSCTNAVSKHTYQKDGTYKVKLTSWHPGPTDAPITDWEGTATVKVGENANSNAELSANPKSGKVPLSVKFSYSHVDTATLTFGDGTPPVTSTCTASSATSTDGCTIIRSHTYTKPGKYNAKLVTGCLSTAQNCNTPVKVGHASINVISNTPTQPTPTPPPKPTYNPCNNGGMSTADFEDCRNYQQTYGDRGDANTGPNSQGSLTGGNFSFGAVGQAFSNGVAAASSALGSAGNAIGGFVNGLLGGHNDGNNNNSQSGTGANQGTGYNPNNDYGPGYSGTAADPQYTHGTGFNYTGNNNYPNSGEGSTGGSNNSSGNSNGGGLGGLFDSFMGFVNGQNPGDSGGYDPTPN